MIFLKSVKFIFLNTKGPLPSLKIEGGIVRSFSKTPTIIKGGNNYVEILTKSKKVKNMVKDYLNLEWYNMSEVYSFIEKDKILKRLKENLYGFISPKMAFNVYEGLIKSIIQQQISLKVAEKMIVNFVKKFSKPIKFLSIFAYDFPKPERVEIASINELKSCGLSERKAIYIKELSTRIVEGYEIDKTKELENYEFIKEITKFKGVGKWTAKIVLVACLSRKDVIPCEDLGIRKSISNLYFGGVVQSVEKIKKIIEEWGDKAGIIAAYILYANRKGWI